MELAVIIKHAFRDKDYRVDIIKVDEDWDYRQVKCSIERDMLGPFEVVGITERYDPKRDIVLESMDKVIEHYKKLEKQKE